MGKSEHMGKTASLPGRGGRPAQSQPARSRPAQSYRAPSRPALDRAIVTASILGAGLLLTFLVIVRPLPPGPDMARRGLASPEMALVARAKPGRASETPSGTHPSQTDRPATGECTNPILDSTPYCTLSSIPKDAARTVLRAISAWVARGAAWLLGRVGHVLDSTTTPELGSAWFEAHYRAMAVLAATLTLPFALGAIVHGIVHQDLTTMLRSIALRLPIALLLTMIALQVVQMGLAVVDAMSRWVAEGSGLAASQFLGKVTLALIAAGSLSGDGPEAPAFVILIAAIGLVIGAFFLWLELVIRTATLYTAVLFLPLALASVVWPAIAHWCRRLIDTIAAIILSKFVIVAILSLAASALNGTQGAPANLAGMVEGIALLLLAVASPFVLLRLVPVIEAGAVGHLEGTHRQLAHSSPVNTSRYAMSWLASLDGGDLGPIGPIAMPGSADPSGPNMGPAPRPPSPPASPSPGSPSPASPSPGSPSPASPPSPRADGAGIPLARGVPLPPEIQRYYDETGPGRE